MNNNGTGAAQSGPADVGPYRLAIMWAEGYGELNPDLIFTDGDELTQELEKDPNNMKILDEFSLSEVLGRQVGKTFGRNYSDAGFGNLVPDALGVLTHGHLSRPPIDSFLGSYDETVTVKSFDSRAGNSTLSFHAWNNSDWVSFGHSLKPFGGGVADSTTGPGATIREDFYWTQTIHVDSAPPGEVLLAN